MWHRDQLEHLNRNPAWCFPAPCSLSGRSGQAAGQWLRAVRSSLPAGTGPLGKGENVIQPEHKGQDGISLLVWWSHVLGKIYLAVPGQSPGGCRAGLIPAWFTCPKAPCETLMAHVAQRGSQWQLAPVPVTPRSTVGRGETLLTQLGTCQYWRCQLDQRKQPGSYREICCKVTRNMPKWSEAWNIPTMKSWLHWGQ